jgi:D-arabinose 1-dehydrogenase-like Zn-dependent alcohol dehydrogenase
VRVLAAGVCHTELQMLAGTLNLGVSPLTLGHEIAGEVAAVGEAVRAVRPGDRVVVYYYAPCGSCRWCRSGAEQLCPDAGPQVGFTADGGFAPYVRVPAPSLVPLPASVPFDEAATIGCSVATALHAVRAAADLRLGETAVVYGVGAVGFALVQLARLAGARVLAIGRTPAKLALARELGAEATANAAETDPVDAVLRWTAGEGADVVFECVAAGWCSSATGPPASPSTPCCSCCARRGCSVRWAIRGPS